MVFSLHQHLCRSGDIPAGAVEGEGSPHPVLLLIAQPRAVLALQNGPAAQLPLCLCLQGTAHQGLDLPQLTAAAQEGPDPHGTAQDHAGLLLVHDEHGAGKLQVETVHAGEPHHGILQIAVPLGDHVLAKLPADFLREQLLRHFVHIVSRLQKRKGTPCISCPSFAHSAEVLPILPGEGNPVFPEIRQDHLVGEGKILLVNDKEIPPLHDVPDPGGDAGIADQDRVVRGILRDLSRAPLADGIRQKVQIIEDDRQHPAAPKGFPRFRKREAAGITARQKDRRRLVQAHVYQRGLSKACCCGQKDRPCICPCCLKFLYGLLTDGTTTALQSIPPSLLHAVGISAFCTSLYGSI